MNESKKTVSAKSVNPLHFAAIANQVEIGKLLLEKYSINSVDRQNHTPLMFAIKNHSKEFIQFLLQHQDIDINFQDDIFICLFNEILYDLFFNGILNFLDF